MNENGWREKGPKKYKIFSWPPVAHTYNPSYSEGREDLGSNPVQANSLRDPILKKKNPSQEKAGGVAQGVGIEFKL
jgi:hypothetical protein